MIRGTEAEYQSVAGSTKDTPYLALTGELWGVFCEYLWEKWPRYNGTALYIPTVPIFRWTKQWNTMLLEPLWNRGIFVKVYPENSLAGQVVTIHFNDAFETVYTFALWVFINIIIGFHKCGKSSFQKDLLARNPCTQYDNNTRIP